MQFKCHRFGRKFIYAGLIAALSLGILGSCSRKIIAKARLSSLDAKDQPFFDEAQRNVPHVVKRLTSFGSVCRLCWYMPRDKLTGSHKAQEYLASVLKEPIMEPCRKGAQIYGCKLGSEEFLHSLKQINADYAVSKIYAVSGLAMEAVFLKSTIAALRTVMRAVVLRLSATYGGGTVCALADGPFPFGDVIGVVIAAGGTIWCIYDLYKAHTQFPLELTAVLVTITRRVFRHGSRSYPAFMRKLWERTLFAKLSMGWWQIRNGFIILE